MRNKHLRRANKERRAALRANHGLGYSLVEFARERPLLVVGAGIAMGMAIGSIFAWRYVDEEMIDDGLELASDGYEKAKSAVQQGLDAATGMFHGGADASTNGASSAKNQSSAA